MGGTGEPKCPDCAGNQIDVYFVRHLSGRCQYIRKPDGTWAPDFERAIAMDDPLDEMYTVVNAKCTDCGTNIEIDLNTDRPVPRLRPVRT